MTINYPIYSGASLDEVLNELEYQYKNSPADTIDNIYINENDRTFSNDHFIFALINALGGPSNAYNVNVSYR